MTIDRDLSDMLRDRWVEARKYLKQPLPLILHEELYVHFGEWCQIVEANVYDSISNAEVVIENRSGDRTTVEFSNLSWRANRDLVDAMSRKPINQLIAEGP